MRPLTANIITARNQPYDTAPMVHLLAIALNPSQTVYLTDDNQKITYGGHDYLSFPFTVGPLTQDSQGNLNTRSLGAANLTTEFTSMVRQQRGLPDALVALSLFRSGEAVLTEEYTINNITITDDAVSFTLGLDSFADKPFPRRKYNRNFCGWTYGSSECGATAGVVAALPTCSRLLNDANGCVAHGQKAVDLGSPRIHPGRFGAFPAQPKQ